RFKIKTVSGANDVASLREVISRRFRRAAEALGEAQQAAAAVEIEGDNELSTTETIDADRQALERWADLPDLLLVDGGPAQVAAAQTALHELGFAQIPVVGVAKGPDRNRFDLVRAGSEPLVLARDSKALALVQRIDEEAHRFAIAYHRKLRNKAALRSPLEEIPGIGPKRKRALLKAFGSLDGIRRASVDEIAAVPGMTRKAAEELKSLL
ncbi:MAG: helix-hairpin-helix domain-containing protein, partial [Chloroflexus sp.]